MYSSAIFLGLDEKKIKNQFLVEIKKPCGQQLKKIDGK
jgi:hypothetical protein